MSNLGPLAELRLSPQEIEGDSCAAQACRFADEVADERWLVLSGRPGSGRTRLAAELANRRIERDQRTLYFVAADLLDQLRAAYRRDAQMPYPVLFEHARSVAFLIIDDIDLANPTEWAREKLFQLLNHRWNARLRTALIAADAGGGQLGVARWLQGGLGVLHLERAPALSASVTRYHQIGGLREDLLSRYTFNTFRVRGADIPANCNLSLVKQIVEEWAAKPHGWLTLRGGTGIGKTHLAAAAVNAALARGDEVWFASVPDLLDVLRRAYQPGAERSYDEVFSSLRNAPLLVLDDLGAHSPTPWADEKLYQLCAARYVAELPTMFTTNVHSDDMDPRIASRLDDYHKGKLFDIEAPDYRTPEKSKKQSPNNRRPRGRSGAR